MEYGASRSDKTGYRVGKPLIFATGINRIRSNLGSVAEWSRALVLLSGGPGFQASPLLLVGFDTPIGSPQSKCSVMLCK